MGNAGCLACALERSCVYNKLFQLSGISSDKFASFDTLVKEYEGWHCSNANFLGNLFLLIDINFIKQNIGVVPAVWECFKNRGDRSARSTPCCPEINQHRFITVDKLLELCVSTILSLLVLNSLVREGKNIFNTTYEVIVSIGILDKRFSEVFAIGDFYVIESKGLAGWGGRDENEDYLAWGSIYIYCPDSICYLLYFLLHRQYTVACVKVPRRTPLQRGFPTWWIAGQAFSWTDAIQLSSYWIEDMKFRCLYRNCAYILSFNVIKRCWMHRKTDSLWCKVSCTESSLRLLVLFKNGWHRPYNPHQLISSSSCSCMLKI